MKDILQMIKKKKNQLETESLSQQDVEVLDRLGYLEAFRTWKVYIDEEKESYKIYSAFQLNLPEVECWPPYDPYIAKCHLIIQNHKSPSERCQCGIYGLRKENFFYFNHPGISGKVKLWGKVVEGEKGYRAEFAYPSEFHKISISICSLCGIKHGVASYKILTTNFTKSMEMLFMETFDKPNVSSFQERLCIGCFEKIEGHIPSDIHVLDFDYSWIVDKLTEVYLNEH